MPPAGARLAGWCLRRGRFDSGIGTPRGPSPSVFDPRRAQQTASCGASPAVRAGCVVAAEGAALMDTQGRACASVTGPLLFARVEDRRDGTSMCVVWTAEAQVTLTFRRARHIPSYG